MTITCTDTWINHTRVRPCPICHKSDRCLYTEDGAHRCFRIMDEQPGWKAIKICADGTRVFRSDDGLSNGHAIALTHPRPPRKKKITAHDWAKEADDFTRALTDDRLGQLARDLSVTSESLIAIGCGWAEQSDLRRLEAFGKDWALDYPAGAWAFPERDAKDCVIGMTFRTLDGRKGAPKGAKRGLTIPSSLKTSPDPVLAVEGPSDVAACLSLGLSAVGRPNNTGGLELLAELLHDRDVIVVGENDQRLIDGGNLRWPGKEGAESISRGLASRWLRTVLMVMPPKGFKDLRVWLTSRFADRVDEEARNDAGQQVLADLQASVIEVHPTPPEVTFSIEITSGRKISTVTASIAGEVVAVDSFKPTSAKRRFEFARMIVDKDKRLKVEEVEAGLLEAVTPSLMLPPAQPDDEEPKDRDALLAEYDEETRKRLDKMPQKTIDAADRTLSDPNLVNLILDDIRTIGVVGEQVLALSVFLIGVSRLLTEPDHPLAGIVQGLSSSGKSFVIELVSRLFPDEAVLRCTDITPQALFYLPNGRLIHRFVVAGERSRKQDDQRAEATRALREMLSSGTLVKAVPTKINGRMETILVKQDGPIAFLESTTLTSLFDEDANRCFLLGTDESPEQTARIMEAIARQASSPLATTKAVIARHHALQRSLRRLQVSVPFAPALAEEMPCERPEARRAISHTLQLIKAVALLHQRQRCDKPLEHGDTIEATVDDYRIARKLLLGPLGRALGGSLPDAVTNLAGRLKERYCDEHFTASQAAADDPILKTRGKMGEYLQTLREAGVTEIVTEGKGSRAHVWRIVGEPPVPGALWLPEGDALEGWVCPSD